MVCKDCGCEIEGPYLMVDSCDNSGQLPQCFDCYGEAYELYMTNDEDDE